MSHSALVVCTDGRRLSAYKRALAEVVDVIYEAATFAHAKALLLEKRPDVLVTEVRLLEFNGIHLVMWGREHLPQLRSVIVDTPDSVRHNEANATGAAYLHQDDLGAIAGAVRKALAGQIRPRRWPRKRLSEYVSAQIGEHPARLVDVSYGGFCVEMAASVIDDPEASFTLDIPEFGMRARAKRVWTTEARTAGLYWCGAALAEEGPGSRGWCRFVDALVASR